MELCCTDPEETRTGGVSRVLNGGKEALEVPGCLPEHTLNPLKKSQLEWVGPIVRSRTEETPGPQEEWVGYCRWTPPAFMTRLCSRTSSGG
jgi:hypothetical protein